MEDQHLLNTQPQINFQGIHDAFLPLLTNGQDINLGQDQDNTFAFNNVQNANDYLRNPPRYQNPQNAAEQAYNQLMADTQFISQNISVVNVESLQQRLQSARRQFQAIDQNQQNSTVAAFNALQAACILLESKGYTVNLADLDRINLTKDNIMPIVVPENENNQNRSCITPECVGCTLFGGLILGSLGLLGYATYTSLTSIDPKGFGVGTTTEFPNISNNRITSLYYKDANGNTAKVKEIRWQTNTNITSENLPAGIQLNTQEVDPNVFNVTLAASDTLNVNETGIPFGYTVIPGEDILSQLAKNPQFVTIVLEDGTVIENVSTHNAVAPLPAQTNDMTASFKSYDAGWTPNGFPAIPPEANKILVEWSSIKYDANWNLATNDAITEGVIYAETDNIRATTGRSVGYSLTADNSWQNMNQTQAANSLIGFANQYGSNIALDFSTVNFPVDTLAPYLSQLSQNGVTVSLIVSPTNVPSTTTLNNINGHMIVNPKMQPSQLTLAGSQQNFNTPNDNTGPQVGNNTMAYGLNQLAQNGFPQDRTVAALDGWGTQMPVDSTAQNNGYGNPLRGTATPVTTICAEKGEVCPPGLNITQVQSPNKDTNWYEGTDQSGKPVVVSTVSDEMMEETTKAAPNVVVFNAYGTGQGGNSDMFVKLAELYGNSSNLVERGESGVIPLNANILSQQGLNANIPGTRSFNGQSSAFPQIASTANNSSGYGIGTIAAAVGLGVTFFAGVTYGAKKVKDYFYSQKSEPTLPTHSNKNSF